MIGEVHETSVPAEFVEVRSPAPVANMTRGHERVQHQYRRRAPAARAWKKIHARNVVRGKFRIDRAAPPDCCSVGIANCTRDFAIAGRSVKIMRCELLAFGDIALHLIAAARMQSMPRLNEIHRCAHEQIDARRGETCNFGVWRHVAAFESADMSAHSKAFPWRMRKVVIRE